MNTDRIPVRFNKSGDIIIPLFRVGVRELTDGELVSIWETFRDFKTTGKGKK